MKVTFHRLVHRDVIEIKQFYELEAGKKIADEFFDELLEFVRRAAENPTRYHPASSRLRRVT